MSDFTQRLLDDCVQAQKRGLMRMDMDFSTGFMLVAQLQLALRHPANQGSSAELCRRFLKGLIDKLSVTPTIREALEQGNDPRRDELASDLLRGIG